MDGYHEVKLEKHTTLVKSNHNPLGSRVRFQTSDLGKEDGAQVESIKNQATTTFNWYSVGCNLQHHH